MSKFLLSVCVAVLLFAAPALAGWDDSVLRSGADVTLTGTSTLDGPVVIGESLDTELAPQTCAEYTYAAGWACADSPLTFTRTASGSNLTMTPTAQTIAVGTTYKVTYTIGTPFAGTFSATVGGTAGATRTTTSTTNYVDYLQAATTGKLIFTAVAASTGTISGISVKAYTSTLSPASGPVAVYKDFASATANESALVVTGNQTGAAGDKAVITANFVGTAGSGAEYLYVGKNAGTQTFSVTAAGAMTVNTLTSGLVAGTYFTASSGSATNTFSSVSAFTNAAHASYSFSGKPEIHAAGSDLAGFSSAPDLSSDHTGGNWISYSAPDLVSADAQIGKYGVKIGTGYDVPIIATPPATQTIAAGNVITADACGTIKQVTAAGGVTTDTTHSITDPATRSGCCMDVYNVGAQIITIDTNTTLVVGGAANLALGALDAVRFCSNGTNWLQMSAVISLN